MPRYPNGFTLNNPKTVKLLKDDDGGPVGLVGEFDPALLIPVFATDKTSGNVTGMLDPDGGIIHQRSSPVGNVTTIRPFGTQSAAGSSAQREAQMVFQFPARPIAVRLKMSNLEASPPTGITATFSGSTTLGSPAYVLPTGAAWAAQTWAGSTSLAAGPARVSATIAGVDETADFIPVDVPDRTDGGQGFILFVRIHPGTGGFSFGICSNAGTAASLNSEANAGRCGFLLSALRNNTTSTAAGNEANYNTGAIGHNGNSALILSSFVPLHLLEVLFDNGIKWEYAVGDSTCAGSQTTSNIMSCPAVAAAQAGIGFVNDGKSQETSATYSARALAYIEGAKRLPQRVWYPAWSPNDYNTSTPSVTTALMDAAKGRLLAIIDAVARRPEIEVLVVPTPWPWDALNLANDTARLSFRSWLMKLRHPKVRVVDVEPWMSNGASPARWKDGLSPDGLHPGDQAAAVYAIAEASAL